MLYLTNVALQIMGDRVEKGTEIELSEKEAKRFDPADITPVSAIEEEPEEVETPEVPIEEMTAEQLKAKAKELDLKTGGSKADLIERITLHLEAPEEENVETPDDGEAPEEE